MVGNTPRLPSSPPARQRLLPTYRLVLDGSRRGAVLAVVLTFLSGLAEALALATLLPILQRGSKHTTLAWGLSVTALFLAAMAGAVVLRICADIQVARVGGVVELRLRNELLAQILTTDWRHASAARHGETVSALMSESSQVANGVIAFLSAVSALGVATVLIAAAGIVGGTLMAGAVVFAAVSGLLYRRTTRLVRGYQRDFAESNAAVNEDANTLLLGLKYFRSTGTAPVWQSRLVDAGERLRSLKLRQVAAPVMARGAVEVLGSVFLATVLLAALSQGTVSRALVFLAVFYRIVPRLQAAQGQLLVARSQMVWWDRWTARSADLSASSERREGCDAPPAPVTRIELDDVWLSFPGRDHGALRGVTLTLERGMVYALVGETGGGKSSIVDLLTGLLAPDRGSVKVDGVDLRDLDLSSWQRSLALVPQEPVLLQRSIHENVVWPTAGTEATVRQALTKAGLMDFVDSLPEGLETSVGQRGTALSGGQRQRLALARALHTTHGVVLLDEATSALDPDTERRVLEAVLADRDAITVFVTHRHEAARLADLVIVVHDGKVRLVGTPETALAATHG